MKDAFKEKNNSHIKVGILEIRRHPPVLNTFMKICKTNKTNVTVFTTEKIINRVKTHLKNIDEYNIILKKKYESNYSFIKKVEKYCNENIDILFVNTIHETIFDLLCYINFKPDTKKVLVIHHVNAWLKPRLVFKPLNLLRTIDTNFGSALIKRFVLPKFDAINVIYKPMKKYIENETDYKKEVFTIPTSVFEEEKIKNLNIKNNDKIKMILPGGLQEHRRDYDTIMPAIKDLFEKHGKEISLSVPGAPVGNYGWNIYSQLKELKEKGYDLTIFDSFVEEKTFNKELEESDIILAPIRINTRADNEITEQYGKSVGSGIIYNAILYAKPIIVPEEFIMLDDLKTSTIKYKNHIDFEKEVEKLIENPNSLKELKKQALKNARKMSLKTLQDYFEETILRWVRK